MFMEWLGGSVEEAACEHQHNQGRRPIQTKSWRRDEGDRVALIDPMTQGSVSAVMKGQGEEGSVRAYPCDLRC